MSESSFLRSPRWNYKHALSLSFTAGIMGSYNISELTQILKTEEQGEPFRGHGRVKAPWTQK